MNEKYVKNGTMQDAATRNDDRGNNPLGSPYGNGGQGDNNASGKGGIENSADAASGATNAVSKDNTSKTISEAEAKLLLIEETRKANQSLQAQEKKNRKTLVAVIVIAVVLCAAALVFALVIGKGHEDSGVSNPSPSQPTQPTTPVVDDNTDTGPDSKLIALEIDDEQVRQLYNYFGALGTADLFGFYDNAKSTGQPSNAYMTGVAMANIDHTTCKMPLSDENIQERYAEQIDAGSTVVDLSTVNYNMGCYRGEDLRAKTLEIFGKDISLKDGDKAIISGWQYSSDYDELYSIAYVGGNDGFGPGKGYLRGIYEAWQDPETDEIYLSEVVAEISGPSLICRDQTNCLGETTPSIENAVMNKDKFDNYRWVFTKTPTGNYVFSELEKL